MKAWKLSAMPRWRLTKFNTSSKQQQYGRLCGGENFGPTPRFPAVWSARRARARRRPDRPLVGEPDRSRASPAPPSGPRRCRRRLRTGSESFCHSGLGQEIGHAGEFGGVRASGGEVVERGEGVRLAAAELGDQSQDRRGVLGFCRKVAGAPCRNALLTRA